MSYIVPRSTDCISRQAALVAVKDALMAWSYMPEWRDEKILEAIAELPPAQPEQLEQCPIYGGMCAYPSDQCYDCPRHAGAKMEVTECIERPKSLGFDRRPEWPFGGDET